jgi:hypothetical protein
MTHVAGSGYDVARWKNLRVWAENGLIRIEDAKDDSYEVIPVSAAKARIRAQVDILKSGHYDASGRRKLSAFIDHVLEIMQKAQVQGMPSDPQASRDLKDRRAKSVVVPADIMGIK